MQAIKNKATASIFTATITTTTTTPFNTTIASTYKAKSI